MDSFFRPTGREKSVELLRWICVLPAAVVGGLVIRYVGGVVGRLAAYGWGPAAESGFVYYLQLLLFYVPKEAAFVIAGAMMAPRSRLATTLVLAVAGMLMSLVVHILGQSHVGAVNYTHFALESTGAALGAAFMFYLEKILRRGTEGGAVSTEERPPRT